MDIETRDLPTWHHADYVPDRLRNDARHRITRDRKEVSCWACIAMLEARDRMQGKTVFGKVSES